MDLEKKKNDFFKKHPWWNNTRFIIITILSIATAIVLILEIIITLLPSSNKLTNAELKERTLELSSGIMYFVTDRQTNEPKLDNNDWVNSSQEISRYSTETRNLYIQRFSSKASFYYDEFKKRGMVDSELDLLINDPVNSIGMRDVAIKLGAFAYELK